MNSNRVNFEQKDFLGRGWANPVALNIHTGGVLTVEYEDDIRQSILIILETAPGERMMRPNFGCGIHDLVFTSVDTTAIQLIRSTVMDALRQYEARIDVMSVEVNEEVTREGKLLVEIEYQVRKTNQTGNIVFPFYFREGGRP